MDLVEVQGHEQRVLVPVVAAPESRLRKAQRLVERQGRRVARAHFEVHVASVGIGGERGADQGAGVPVPAVLGPYGDGGDVQLAEDVANPDVTGDLTSVFDHQVEAVG